MVGTEAMRGEELVHARRYGAWLAALGFAHAAVLVYGWHVLPWLRELWEPAALDGSRLDVSAVMVSPMLVLTAWGVGWRARHAIVASRRPLRVALACTLAGSYAFAVLLLVVGALAVLVDGPEDRGLALAVLAFSWAFALPYGLLGWLVFAPLALPLTWGCLVLLRRAGSGVPEPRTSPRGAPERAAGTSPTARTA